jgi:hypothetical protein
MYDRSIDSSAFQENDRLDRSRFVEALVDVIDRAQSPADSSVFALIGPWGAGKTSIIDAATSIVSQRHEDGRDGPQWIVAKFNPWLYSDIASLHQGFFAELRTALPKGAQWEDLQRRLSLLQKVASPVAAMSSIFVRGAKDASDGIFAAFARSGTQVQAEADAALRNLDRPVLMVLDDLDRLTSTELLEVFKLIRLIGRLPNVYYLLCYDERTLTDVIENTELVGAKNDGRALDYLEKVVQLRFDIPPMRPEHSETIFSDATAILLDREGIVPNQSERVRVAQIFGKALAPRFDTPRTINKFIGQIEAFFPSVAGDVDWVDFFLISWIRTLEPALYGQLHARKTFLLGIDPHPIRNKEDALADASNELNDLLKLGRVRPVNHPGVIIVLAELFPAVKRIRDRTSNRNLPRTVDRRISDIDFFDRYFLFGVPADDISDSAVAEALGDLATETATAHTRLLTQQMMSDPGRTVRKIERVRNGGGQITEAIARWIGQVYPDLGTKSQLFSARDIAERYFASLLVEIPLAHAEALVDELAQDAEGARLSMEAISVLGAQQVGDATELDKFRRRSAELKPLLETICRRRLDATHGADVFAVPRGDWIALDVVARLVTSSIPIGVPEASGRISGFETELVGALIDLDWVTEQVVELMDSARPVAEFNRVEDTPENRRNYVLGILRDRRDELKDLSVPTLDLDE